MRSVLDPRFKPDERFNLEELHEEVLRQFHTYRRKKEEGIPEWATGRKKRLKHLEKWEYIHDRFAGWLAQLDQQTMVGSKLNKKFDEIEAEGETVDWDNSTIYGSDNNSHVAG